MSQSEQQREQERREREQRELKEKSGNIGTFQEQQNLGKQQDLGKQQQQGMGMGQQGMGQQQQGVGKQQDIGKEQHNLGQQQYGQQQYGQQQGKFCESNIENKPKRTNIWSHSMISTNLHLNKISSFINIYLASKITKTEKSIFMILFN